MEEIIFEQENGEPEDWVQNVVFVRDGKGNMVELKIPNDEEG